MRISCSAVRTGTIPCVRYSPGLRAGCYTLAMCVCIPQPSSPMLNTQSHTADWIVFPRNNHSTSQRYRVSQRTPVHAIRWQGVDPACPTSVMHTPIYPPRCFLQCLSYSLCSLHIRWLLGLPFILVIFTTADAFGFAIGASTARLSVDHSLVVSLSRRLIRSDILETPVNQSI